MTPQEPLADDTVRVSPPARRLSTPLVAAVAGVAALLIAGGAGWWLWPVRPPARVASVPAQVVPAPSPQPQVAVAPPPSPTPEFAINTAGEDQILHHTPTDLTV